MSSPRESDCYNCKIKKWCNSLIVEDASFTNSMGFKKDFDWNKDGQIYIKNCEGKKRYTKAKIETIKRR